MSQVWMKAKQSFVNRMTGSVTKNQRIFVTHQYAVELKKLNLADYENTVDDPDSGSDSKKSNPSQKAAADGKIAPSASLPVETASQTSKSEKPKNGSKAKAGK